MKHKQLYILEAIIVVLILSILLYTSVPKAVKSQHRAQISQLETAMQSIKNHLAKHPYDNTVLQENAGSYSMFTSGPKYNQRDQSLTLFYSKRDVMELNIDALEKSEPSIRFPDWTLSDLKLAGYAVYQKESPENTMLDGYSDIPVYIAVIARVGTIDDNHFMNEPYHVGIDKQGVFEFYSYSTNYNPSNGLNSNGEFLVDTKEIWSATKAVLLHDLQEGFNPNWFQGINMDTVNIIRFGDL